MNSIRDRVSRGRVALVAAATAVLLGTALVGSASAQAAPSPTTGIDYVTDLVTPIKAELTLAIVAGLGLVVVLMAVRAGFKLIRSFGK